MHACMHSMYLFFVTAYIQSYINSVTLQHNCTMEKHTLLFTLKISESYWCHDHLVVKICVPVTNKDQSTMTVAVCTASVSTKQTLQWNLTWQLYSCVLTRLANYLTKQKPLHSLTITSFYITYILIYLCGFTFSKMLFILPMLL